MKRLRELWTPTVKKRAVELILAILTALIAALSTSCAIKWTSNSFELQPYGYWSIGHKPAALATNAPSGPP